MSNGLSMDDSDFTDSASLMSTDQLKILKDGTDLNHQQETPVPHFPSELNSPSSSRRRLEERITSRISQLMVRSSNGSAKETFVIEGPAKKGKEGAVKVLKLKKLSALANSSQFRLQYGSFCALAVGEMIVLGTSKGHVLTMDFHQTSQKIYQERQTIQSGPVTSLAVSADSTYIAAGYENGSIFVWDISKSSNFVLAIPGLTQQDLTKKTKEGHLVGSKIHQLMFVGKRHTALISADNNGLLCYHNGYRNVLGYHIISRNILGRYSYNQSPKSPILSTAMLPMGTHEQETDSLGLTAVMTPHILIVISIYPQLQTHFKIGRPKGISKSAPISACLSWLPALATNDGSFTTPKLCYCWSNYLTVFDVTHEVMKNNDTNEESIFVKFENKKRWVGKESIVAVQWLNSRVVSVLTNGHRLLLISEANMQVLNAIDLLGKNIRSTDFFNDDIYENVYVNSFKSFKGKMFIMGENDVFVTSLNNWADTLMSIIKEGDYIRALKQAREFYMSDDGDLVIYGLPSSPSQRRSVLYENVIQLMTASLDYIFKNLESTYEADQNLLKDFLEIYFQIFVDFEGKISGDLLDLAYEKFYASDLEETFFNSLKGFILKEKITKVTPTILKALVKILLSKGQGDELEELICLLDLTDLDIDFTISLCEEHHLRDSLVYIWNKVLGDYVTPIFDFIKMIVPLLGEDGSGGTDNGAQILEASKVYGYLTYTLTGRQYPTERSIDFENLRRAKMNLYYVLLNGASLPWPKGGAKIHISNDIQHEPAFPYLFLLLKFNCFEALGALNEIFEDDFLNDDGSEYNDLVADYELRATRQYIIDILFEIFKSNEQEFSQLENTYMAIFVARNLPKFKQFITLSDSTCEDLIELLCSYPDSDLKEDCELSLQSLLSVYHPLNVNDLIYFFERAGFYDVLFNVYRSEQKFHKVLEIWLSNKERVQLEKEVLHKSADIYEKDSDIVRKCFELTKDNNTERAQVQDFIKKNFEALVEEDISEMIKLFSRYYPQMHGEILKCSDDQLCFKYLDVLFHESSTFGISKKVKKKLNQKYIELMSKFDKESLFKFLKKHSEVERSDYLLDVLRSNRAIDSLVFLIESSKDYAFCINEICVYFAFLKTEIIKILSGQEQFSKFYEIENELWKYLFMGIKICDYDFQTSPSDGLLNANEWAWSKIIESTVDILKVVNTQLLEKTQSKEETYILNTIKRLVQDAFTNLINSRSAEDLVLEPHHEVDSSPSSQAAVTKRKLSFFNVFTEFLQTSSSSAGDTTRLSDVRMILSEIFLSYKYDTVLQATVLKLINAGIFEEFSIVNGCRLRGLSSKRPECDACGKVLWGFSINNEIYDTWRDNQLFEINKGVDRIEIKDDKKDDNCVTIFKCGHGYHGRCLASLSGGSKTFCIICDK